MTHGLFQDNFYMHVGQEKRPNYTANSRVEDVIIVFRTKPPVFRLSGVISLIFPNDFSLFSSSILPAQRSVNPKLCTFFSTFTSILTFR